MLRLARTTFACAVVAGSLGHATSTGASSPLRIVQGGFSSDRYSRTAADVSYGVVLKNQSTKDAIRVRVTAELVGAGGHVVGSDPQTVSFIPAGKTFGLGGQIILAGPPQQVRLGVAISVGEMKPAHLVLPPVKVRLQGGLCCTGSFTNPYGQVIYTNDATLHYVQYDSLHRVVGGNADLLLTTDLDQTVPPHRTRDIEFLAVSPHGKTVKSVAIWADPGFVPR